MTFLKKKQNMIKTKRLRRSRRVRAKIKEVSVYPRLCVFRSHKYIYAQLIDDGSSRTLVSAHGPLKGSKEVGKKLAEKAKKAKISRAVFDKGSYAYHGHVRALAQGAREGNLLF